jgi:hypothetical protein
VRPHGPTARSTRTMHTGGGRRGSSRGGRRTSSETQRRAARTRTPVQAAKARVGLPSASGSTNAPRGNASGYFGARRAEPRCARLRWQPCWGHVVWERKQPRRGCAADPRANMLGHGRADRKPCHGRAGRTRAEEPDRATPGAR